MTVICLIVAVAAARRLLRLAGWDAAHARNLELRKLWCRGSPAVEAVDGSAQHAFMNRVLIVAVCVLLTACVSAPPTLPTPLRQGVELTEVSFHPQEDYQCGPAALATVLNAADVQVSPEELVGAVYLPARQGSLQVELLAAVRARGRVPYLLEGTLAAVVAELMAGRPVLVMQNLGVKAIPVWHYAVVVGFDPARDELILRSGTDPRRRTSLARFERTWSRSQRWGFVVLKPGELPVDADRGRYFRSIAALEATGQLAAAEAGYLAMAARWPEDPDAQLGLGNVYFAQGRLRAAERAYRKALALSGGAMVVARNNLAMVLITRGCAAAGLAEAERALAGLDEGHPLHQSVAQTRAEAGAAVASGAQCPDAQTLDPLEDVGDAEQVENDDHDKNDADNR